MTWHNLTYLAIDVFSLAGPLAWGFTRFSGFNAKWRAFLPGLLGLAALFLIWDAWFTAKGIWGFSEAFHLPFLFFGMPLEEWLFFVCIPFACLFIHDCVKRLPSWHPSEKWARSFFMALSVGLLSVAAFHTDRMYSVTAFGLAGVFSLAIGLGALKHSTGHFTITFLFHCIPFFIVNGILTGIPIVVYDDSQNLGMRMGSIPVEDLAYSLSLIGLNVLFYEYLLAKTSRTPN
jgi:lycopene cyclase domain-containing protein